MGGQVQRSNESSKPQLQPCAPPVSSARDSERSRGSHVHWSAQTSPTTQQVPILLSDWNQTVRVLDVDLQTERATRSIGPCLRTSGAAGFDLDLSPAYERRLTRIVSDLCAQRRDHELRAVTTLCLFVGEHNGLVLID